MEFPQAYIKRGKHKLHSGGESDVFYDVNELLTDKEYRKKILEKIPESPHYVGIATGGAIIAALVADERGATYSLIKDGEHKGQEPQEEFILIDDVYTTGGSLKEALDILGKEPKEIFVIVNREDGKKLDELEGKVNWMYSV